MSSKRKSIPPEPTVQNPTDPATEEGRKHSN